MHAIKQTPVILLVLATCLLIGCTSVTKKNSTPKQSRKVVSETKQTDQEPIRIKSACILANKKESPHTTVEDKLIHPSKPIWQIIKEGFRLPDINHSSIDHELSILLDQPEILQLQLNSSLPLLNYVMQEVHKRGLPSEIALIPFIESGYTLEARSSMNAKGLWQFMPATARSLELSQSWWHDDSYNAVLSTEAALNYLESQHARFGDWVLAIAAYNAGPARIASRVSRSKSTARSHQFFSLHLPNETKRYIPKLLAYKKLIARHNQYAIIFSNANDHVELSKLYIDQQISLNVVASIGAIDNNHLYQYNPGYKRWATPPNGNSVLLLPRNAASLARKKIPTLSNQERMPWNLYKIRAGDSLSTIANKNNVSISTLKKLNSLQGDKIIAGKQLKIPTSESN